MSKKISNYLSQLDDVLGRMKKKAWDLEPEKQDLSIVKKPQEQRLDPLLQLPEDIRRQRGLPLTLREREDMAETLRRDQFDDDVEERIEEEVSEYDFKPNAISDWSDEVLEKESEEVPLEIGESDTDLKDDVDLEDNGLVNVEELPTDEEVVEEIREEGGEDFETNDSESDLYALPSDDGRLAGLNEDVSLEEKPMVAEDDEDKKKKKKPAKEGEWDGEHENLLKFLYGALGKIPRHRGSLFGCQRAYAYLQNILDVLAKGMRGDLCGKVDEDAAEAFRVKLLKDMSALDQRIQYLSDQKIASEDSGMVKEAGGEFCNACGAIMWKNADNKAECLVCGGESALPGLDKVGVEKSPVKKEASTAKISLVADPLLHGIASVIINSKVSAGKNPEDIFEKMAKDYNLDNREKFAVIHLLSNMGYPLYMDRGRILEGDSDSTDGKGVDWLTNYYA